MPERDSDPSSLPPRYDPTEAEGKWYPIWEKAGYFAPSGDAEPYTIVIPPPNVTGALHMGHALTVTIEDILIRWRRMQGRRTLWLPGTDHAGIATQMVVERDLMATEGKSRHDIGRTAFLERVWAWKKQYGGRISEQLRVMGCSLDWSRERFTMDELLSRAVKEVFVRLFEEGLIYRAERLVNWCPRCHTALSDLEVEHDDAKQGELWSFAYPLKDGSGELVVATTRPETMLGDTAVAVHPEDERYEGMIGKSLRHPLLGYELPVIADAELVDPEFGTGAVKVTPAHDFNDFATGKRHNLVLFNIFDVDAKIAQAPGVEASIYDQISDESWGRYKGLDRMVARDRVKEDLEQKGLGRGSESHAMAIGACQRCYTILEPSLSVQWWVATESLAAPALDAVRSGKTRIIPSSWTKTYYHWMENIQDWCISRQLWWGHRIPAWYCTACDAHKGSGDSITFASSATPVVAREAPTKCERCGGDLVQDTDVLDTWFSSALWPFSTLGWPDDNDDVRAFYPNAVMETGFDILFFWVARMMMMGCKFMGEPPFPTIYLHAMIRDKRGDKMSKTRGNVIDPLHLIHGCSADVVSPQFKSEYPEGFPAFGADALRFTLAAMSGSGRDIRLSVERIAGYRNFANKIWNASRFVLMRLDGATPAALNEVESSLEDADRFILSELSKATDEIDAALEAFRFADAANAIYRFFWEELCDWYIELTKPRLIDDDSKDSESRAAAQATLVFVLDHALRLLHPIMPFITEEIWQRLPLPPSVRDALPDSIMIAEFPVALAERWRAPEVERTYALVKDAIVGVRTIRSESNVAPSKKIEATLLIPDASDRKALEAHKEEIITLARLSKLTLGDENTARPPQAGVKVLERMEVVVPLAGLVDFAEEAQRLHKAIAKAGKERERLQKKLQNKNFVDRAPPAVVKKDQARADELGVMLDKLGESLQRVEAALGG